MRRALIVHDNSEIRETVAAALRASGFEVQAVPATPPPAAGILTGPWDAVVAAGPGSVPSPVGLLLRPARKDWERRHIERALAEYGGDKTKAAKALGINLSSLYRKLMGDDSAV